MKNQMKNLMNDGILHNLIYEDNKYNLIVREPKNCKTDELSNFKILDLPEDSIVFSLDFELSKGQVKTNILSSKIRNFSWLIKGNHKGANQKCDIIIIVPKPDTGKHLVIIGELKSKLNSRAKRSARDQLNNSRLILDFIFKLLQEYELDDEPRLVFRNVVFSNDRRAGTLRNRTSTRARAGDAIKYVEVQNGKQIHLNEIERIIS